jgi:hypothetical protein
VLGVISSLATPAFAALVVVTSWRIAFIAAALFPAVGLLALRLVAGAASGVVQSRGTSAIPPAVP